MITRCLRRLDPLYQFSDLAFCSRGRGFDFLSESGFVWIRFYLLISIDNIRMYIICVFVTKNVFYNR